MVWLGLITFGVAMSILDLPMITLRCLLGDKDIPDCSKRIKILLWVAMLVVGARVLILVVRLLLRS